MRQLSSRTAGYAAVAAANADEAIRLLEAQEDIRLIFTDISMPGSMDGLQLARYARDHWPAMKIVVTSGHRRRRRMT